MIPNPPRPDAARPKGHAVSRRNGEGGFPHSEIVGSKPAHGSPTLIAACHVLHRLCMPRHPPNALTSRLRVRTTNGSPAKSDFPYVRGASLSDHVAAMRQFYLSLVVTTKEAIIGRTRLSCPVRSVATASIATIHNVKDLYEVRVNAHHPRRRTGGTVSISSWIDQNWWSLTGSNR